jgi:hypothetical protein
VRPDTEYTYRSDGHESARHVQAVGQARAGVGERVNVPPSALENLREGTAWLRVPAIGGKPTRVECIDVALPTSSKNVGPTGEWDTNVTDYGTPWDPWES